MSFVRSKEIPPGSGNWYDYEVMAVRIGGKVRQKVIRYLGKSTTPHVTRPQAKIKGVNTPVVVKIKSGWAAFGHGWAVHGETKEEALKKYEDAEVKHAEIDARPLPVAC